VTEEGEKEDRIRNTGGRFTRVRIDDKQERREYHASEVRRRLEELSRDIAIDIRSGIHGIIDIRVASLFLREEEKQQSMRRR